ncbi:small heat shock protein [Wolfiporia cocos MD-104 SS10]|uniref:Small heat shock protein n=1 Tax=Wolfiporia cocos (strain MD-104) TaxID=742152 RepID=A0A2H3K151_WOLCO|nr:small heat shock protein [Wolfiporia cocos MD-104 SS10]
MSLSSFFYEPFYTLADFDRLFDEAFSARTGPRGQSADRQVQRQDSSTRFLRPRMDLHEDAQANAVTATFELPGLNKENVNIDVHNGVLTVSGEAQVQSDRDEHGYAVRERRYGKFSRAVPLPQGVKSEDIRASMENGVLTVTFPKTTPETAPKKITIS